MGGCYATVMTSVENAARDHTDESLRAERESTDSALAMELVAIDVAADEVIDRARARADEVRAAARAGVDRGSAASGGLERDRAREDTTIERERAVSDRALRADRAGRDAVLSVERGKTDLNLSLERARSDDAVDTRDEFLGMVSHDLRNLLHVVSGYAALICSPTTEAADPVRRHAQRIQRASAQMNRLLGDLIDVASIAAGALGVTRALADPVPVVNEAVEAFQAQAQAAGVSIEIDAEPPSSPVWLDEPRILQVLANLLSNAIKFTSSPGKIVVRMKPSASQLLFSVADTGVGIAADQLEAVFDRFHQATSNDHRGVGLGLYISRSIVQGHRGRIWAESSPGEGTTISFTIPL